jgi:cell division protein FtsW
MKKNRKQRGVRQVFYALLDLGSSLRERVEDVLHPLARRLDRWREPRGRDAITTETAQEPRGLDLPLLCAVFALLGLGMVIIYSGSAVFAQATYGSGSYFLRRNIIYCFTGMIALYLGWRIDYRFYQRWTYPMLGSVIFLLGALLIPGLGTRVDGATRWFHLGGVSFQPSEPAKFALVVYLAYSLAKKREAVRSFSVGFLPHLCVAGLICLLIVKQPDLGTTAVLGTVTLLLLFVAGTKLSYILISILAAAPVTYQLIVGTPWRMRRLLAFLDPWTFRQDAGYQISESLISIGSGGLYGLGLGEGKQKLFFLPAAHTDFIFAITGEELGLVGLLAVIVLFAVIIARGMRAAFGARDTFGRYLAFGLTSIIGLQAILHMCVVLGLVPTKGITLPLVSYGGSALVTTLFCLGVLLNIAACNPAPARIKLEGARAAPVNRKRMPRVVIAGDARISTNFKESEGELSSEN